MNAYSDDDFDARFAAKYPSVQEAIDAAEMTPTQLRAEIARLKDLIREAFNVGWDSREQVVTTRRVQ